MGYSQTMSIRLIMPFAISSRTVAFERLECERYQVFSTLTGVTG